MAISAAVFGKVSIGGAPIAFTGDATALVSGTTYQLTSSLHRKLDPNTPRVWKDNGSPIAAADIAGEDLLFGKVTLVNAPSGAVTLDASYIPTAAIASVTKADLDESNDNQDATFLNAADRYKRRIPVLQDAKVSADLLDDLNTDLDSGTVGTQSFRTYLEAGNPLLFELDPTGGGTNVWRGWLVLDQDKLSFDPAKPVMASVSASLASQSNSYASAGASWGAP